MIQALLQGILNVVTNIINVLLTPLNLLITAIFPDFSIMITNFNTFVSRFLGTSLAYFVAMFPPIFRTLVVFTLNFIVAYSLFTLSYSAAIHIFNIIKKIKFW